jgi:hypothetical protein
VASTSSSPPPSSPSSFAASASVPAAVDVLLRASAKLQRVHALLRTTVSSTLLSSPASSDEQALLLLGSMAGVSAVEWAQLQRYRDVDLGLLAVALSALYNASTPPPSATHVASPSSSSPMSSPDDESVLARRLAGFPYLQACLCFVQAKSGMTRGPAPHGSGSASASTSLAFARILEDPQLPLVDRLAFACRFLSDEELTKYVHTQGTGLAVGEKAASPASTNIGGAIDLLDRLVVCGLTHEGMALLQRYVDATADVQTAAILSAVVCAIQASEATATSSTSVANSEVDQVKAIHQI